MEYASFLRKHIEEILPLTDQEFAIILSCFQPRRVGKKGFLIREGQRVTSEFLVVEGLLKTFMYDDNGKEYIIQFAMENWWVSDYPAYKVQGSGELCVQALEDCLVLELSLAGKTSICRQLPAMHQFYGIKAFNGYVALQKRVLSMMKHSAGEKYQLLLEQYPQLFQRVSRSMIARYLGVTRETLSRLSVSKH